MAETSISVLLVEDNPADARLLAESLREAGPAAFDVTVVRRLSASRSAISAPPAEVTALPLTGTPGPGQYAIMAGIPLGQMKNPLAPGDYTFRVTVYDQVGKQNWTAEQGLKLVAAE